MIGNHLTFTFRYISRSKAFTFINVAGLAIGMMACILILQYVVHELSYDEFHLNKDRIFRVQQDRYSNGELSTRWAAGSVGIGPDLKANFPEVERYTRLLRTDAILSRKDVYFREDALYYASEDFFQIFSIKLIAGESSSVLKDPSTIVLSQSLAKKYFSDQDPIGKILHCSAHNVDCQVTGIFEDLPDNTHMKIEALISFVTLQKSLEDPLMTWEWDGFPTYILLNEKADANALEAKLPGFVEKRVGEQLKKTSAGITFHLQPLTSIHLDSNLIGEFKPNGNRQSTYFLCTIAVLILVIAWINYVNLSTAKSIERASEVGVRKVLGGFRSQLIQQFLFESVLLNVTAFVVSIFFVVLLTPSFSELTNRDLGYALFKQNLFWIAVGILIFGGALVSGIYPAFLLSSYKPVEVLKGKFKNTSSGVRFRKGMVVLQFISSFTLMIGTFTVYTQIRFMRDKELGVNIDHSLVLHSPDLTDGTIGEKFQAFKLKIEQYPEVVSVSAASEVPGHQPGSNAEGIRRLSQREEDSKQYRVIHIDHNFIDAFGLKVIAGRGFLGDQANDRKNVVLNEFAASLMGFKKPEDALDDKIIFQSDTLRIVGVLRNYHHESLKKAFDPLIFRYHPGAFGFYSIKFNSASVRESLGVIEKEWKEMFPGDPFIYFFLDDHYNQQYRADQQFGKVIGMFSWLAIIIACLGLYGLSSLTAIQRTKEIGVRKILGASVPGILAMVSKDYIMLLIVAIVPSVLLGRWVMVMWLSNFAYKIPLTWWIFAIPGVTVVTIAMITVSIQTIKVARANPIKSLRYE